MYAAMNEKAVCGFMVEDGIVVESAPYIWRMVKYERFDRALQILVENGFRVVKVPRVND